MKRLVVSWMTAVVLLLFTMSVATAHDGDHHGSKEETGWPGSARAQEVARAFLADSQPAQELEAESATSCEGGVAAGYPCKNVTLQSFLPLADIGGGKGNDVWGWTDPQTGREYAIMGRTTGTSFVDISEPTNPVYLGNLPTTRFSSTWRDIKVYANHAYVVSESRNHGMQVFDLTQLRAVSNPPVTFSATAHYSGFATAHNIFINEESGFAYAVGTNTCSGGLHIVDLRVPTSPTQAGCFGGDGYTHDVQCVISTLPAYAGRELCFASNEDTLTVVDVTQKSSPVQLARVPYVGAAYTHQGWLTDDQRYFLIDDELDEGKGYNTRTYVFDVADPAAPLHIGTHVGSNPAIDHNQYVVGNYTFQANYRSGLRILDISGVATASLSEVAYFDIYPADDQPEFNGAWSTYPFFASGNVVVSGIEQGLYVLRPNLAPTDASPSVSLEQPADGATVSGSVQVSAVASDDVGVAHVEFFLDESTSIGFDSDGSDGWSTTWDTTAVADGSHTLTARATDTIGQTASDTISVTVDNVNEPPTASYTYTCAGLTCDFDGSDSTDDRGIASYAWDFGDGTTATGPTAQHTFAAGGSYTVSLTVTDSDGITDTQSQAVVVADEATTSHVADLSGFSTNGGSTWTATVTITVVDSTGRPVADAVVHGDWSQGNVSSSSCTTDSNGQCSVTSGSIHKRQGSVTFSVSDIGHAVLTYDPTANVKTSISIAKP